MTKDELKLELDALDVEYPKDAKLADLEALYAPYAPTAGNEAQKTPNEPENRSQTAQDGNDGQPEAEPSRATVNSETGLNVRDAPEGAAIHVLPDGTEVDVLKADGEWSMVSWSADGWVRSEFLK